MELARLAVKVTLLALACSLLLPAPAWCQSQDPVTATWEIGEPPDGGWTLGDLIPLRLLITYAEGVEVSTPQLPRVWGAFEVRDQTLLAPQLNYDSTVTLIFETRVTLWSPGEHETPPLAVRYRNRDGTLGEVAPPPLAVVIASVLSGEELEKRDLKPQASLPRPPVWPWFLLGLLLAALLYFALRWLRSRRQQRGEPAPGEPQDDRFPEEIAYEELDHIAALDLPAAREFKRHYTLVTDCVRVYIEGIIAIPAMDRTTEQVTTALRRTDMSQEALGSLHRLLSEADLVKFARLRPSADQARVLLAQARAFIDETKPARSEVEPAADQPPEP